MHVVTFINICTVFLISGLTLRTDELKQALTRRTLLGTVSGFISILGRCSLLKATTCIGTWHINFECVVHQVSIRCDHCVVHCRCHTFIRMGDHQASVHSCGLCHRPHYLLPHADNSGSRSVACDIGKGDFTICEECGTCRKRFAPLQIYSEFLRACLSVELEARQFFF